MPASWKTQQLNASQKKRGPRTATKAHNKSVYYVPMKAEVLSAVKSLYADNLEPFGRILLRRIRERHPATSNSPEGCVDDAPLVDPKQLHQICKACPGLLVKEVDGNEITVWLLDQPAIFVDVCSPVDPYPSALWAKASSYFCNLRGKDILLPGGRYACAYALASRGLHWLSSMSLGEICHIVQLAVSSKKILGYIDGNMVPYHHSEESVKEHCAVYQQPFCNPAKKQANAPFPVATWEETRACLSAILRATSVPDAGMITVSNVKRIFRSRFGLDLSETALGYARLSELLQDPRLVDVCAVEVRGAGQFVVRPRSRIPPHRFLPVHVHHAANGQCQYPHQPPYCPSVPTPWPEAFDVPRIVPEGTMCGNWEEMAAATGVCLSTKPCLQGELTDQDQADCGWDSALDQHPDWTEHHVEPSVVQPPPGLEMELPHAALSFGGGDILGKQVRRLLDLDEDSRRATLRELCGKTLNATNVEGDDTASTIANSEVVMHLGSGDSWRSALETPASVGGWGEFKQDVDGDQSVMHFTL